MKKRRGFILLEIIVVIVVITILGLSLALILKGKIKANEIDRINQNLYLTGKSTLGVLYDYFENDKALLKRYALNKEEGSFSLEGREDIDEIIVRFNNREEEAIVNILVIDNLGNKFEISAKIPY